MLAPGYQLRVASPRGQIGHFLLQSVGPPITGAKFRNVIFMEWSGTCQTQNWGPLTLNVDGSQPLSERRRVGEVRTPACGECAAGDLTSLGGPPARAASDGGHHFASRLEKVEEPQVTTPILRRFVD